MADDNVANLLVPGVTKAGTSSLYWYLIQHPEICPPVGRKEIDHFTPMRWGRPPAGTSRMYAAHFRACGDEMYRLDASPRYFDGGPRLVSAVQDVTPQARIIILLRDLVRRLWSNYRTLKETGKLDAAISFRDFFDCGVAVYEQGNGTYEQHTNHRVVSLGCHEQFLRDWLDVFGDRVLILFFEHLVADPRALVEKACAWFGPDVSMVATFDYATRNKTTDPRSVRVSKVAYAMNRRIDPMLRSIPQAKDAAHAIYTFINGRRDVASMSDDDHQRARDFYAPKTEALRGLLERHGYTDVPAWVSRHADAH